ncbi:transcriptional regulator, AraC family [Rhizobium sp. RU20A]|nr:transcriptional regulator, AraC family [Rhizobium sp. RU20A]
MSRADCGVERIEARFHGEGFSPHRHDTYALGVTLYGVQTFSYRGEDHFSRPGNVIVLHPDELHDGAAGTEDGLVYRMIYLPPELVGAASDYRQALPFVAKPVIDDREILNALADMLADLGREPDDLLLADVLARISDGLDRHAKCTRATLSPVARAAVLSARDLLTDCCEESVRSDVLEKVTGLTRFELARQFRRVMGTSPHRYLMMRRLDKAKALLAKGDCLAGIAHHLGFADQAHFTRHFRKTFGMTPGRWVTLNAAR